MDETKGVVQLRAKAACDGCKFLCEIWGNKDKQGNRVQSGYWCIARNGRIKAHPKQCEHRKEKGDTDGN
jgi:hypothetical protein